MLPEPDCAERALTELFPEYIAVSDVFNLFETLDLTEAEDQFVLIINLFLGAGAYSSLHLLNFVHVKQLWYWRSLRISALVVLGLH